MYFRLIIATLAFLLAAPGSASPECPGCDPIDAWFAENGGHCGYHGARLPSICELDPDCVDWNRRCKEKGDELRACVARCMAGDHRVLDGGQSSLPGLDGFERDIAELERGGYDVYATQQSPDWCRRQRAKLAELNPIRFGAHIDGLVARIVGAAGDAWVQPCGHHTVGAAENQLLQVGDCIETGSNGRLQLRLNDLDIYDEGIGPSFLNIGPNSKICIDDLQVARQYGTESALINLAWGQARLILAGWNRNNAFNVKAASSVVGVRGSTVSEVIVRIEPSDGSIQLGVIDGNAWIGNRGDGAIRHLGANQWAQDTATGMGPVQQLTRAQWESVLTQDGLDF